MELKEIGKVHHHFPDDDVRDRAGQIDGVITVHPEFAEGISNLENYPYIFVIAIMHKHLEEAFPLKIKPRLLLRKGYRIEDLPEIGVFSSDSPSRPNPIGLSLLRLNRIVDCNVHVSGLDLFDGTPIVDIKPYTKRYCPPDKGSEAFAMNECEEIGRH
ncbi:hypothetical protein IX51_10110 [uncultured archaeon]|nr:hypothetical protein IX51_10110 [uncultured archaeon]